MTAVARSLAMAESSSSWSLGEYAVSIRSDFRSTANFVLVAEASSSGDSRSDLRSDANFALAA